jgi:hypothetical protein
MILPVLHNDVFYNYFNIIGLQVDEWRSKVGFSGSVGDEFDVASGVAVVDPVFAFGFFPFFNRRSRRSRRLLR